jgi:hypothetical protein
MPTTKQMSSVFAFLAPISLTTAVVLSLASSEVEATGSYPNLCDSTRGVCVTVPFADVPRLDQNVCWNGVTAKLKGSGACTIGRAYTVGFGYVSDPLTNTVVALAPVIDTCAAGYCVEGLIDSGEVYEDGVACCNAATGDCSSPNAEGLCTAGDITWCETIEDNGDGTITCHE